MVYRKEKTAQNKNYVTILLRNEFKLYPIRFSFYKE